MWATCGPMAAGCACLWGATVGSHQWATMVMSIGKLVAPNGQVIWEVIASLYLNLLAIAYIATPVIVYNCAWRHMPDT